MTAMIALAHLSDACFLCQDEGAATHAAKLTKAEGQLDFQEEATVLHNKVGLHCWDARATLEVRMQDRTRV